MFAAFVFAAMLAAGILKVLGYVERKAEEKRNQERM